MTPAIILAVALDGTIGTQDRNPFRIANHDRQIQTLCRGKTVIMGRKTWEATPLDGLPECRKIVLSRQLDYAPSAVETARSLDEALTLAGDTETFILGGHSVFAEYIGKSAWLYLTLVLDRPQGDRRILLDWRDWMFMRTPIPCANAADDGDSHKSITTLMRRIPRQLLG